MNGQSCERPLSCSGPEMAAYDEGCTDFLIYCLGTFVVRIIVDFMETSLYVGHKEWLLPSLHAAQFPTSYPPQSTFPAAVPSYLSSHPPQVLFQSPSPSTFPAILSRYFSSRRPHLPFQQSCPGTFPAVLPSLPVQTPTHSLLSQSVPLKASLPTGFTNPLPPGLPLP